jgi:hypothetical protein
VLGGLCGCGLDESVRFFGRGKNRMFRALGNALFREVDQVGEECVDGAPFLILGAIFFAFPAMSQLKVVLRKVVPCYLFLNLP